MAVSVRITRGQPVSDLCCCSLWQEQKPAECRVNRNNLSGLELRDMVGEKTAALAFFFKGVISRGISVCRAQSGHWLLLLAVGVFTEPQRLSVRFLSKFLCPRIAQERRKSQE